MLTTLLSLCLISTPASAAGTGDAQGAPPSSDGPTETLWVGDRYRYGQTGVVRRIFLDVLAIPASAPRWTARGWAEFGLVSGTTVGLMLPLNPSLDARLDQFVYSDMAWLPDIWGMEVQVPLWTSLAPGVSGSWGAALIWDWPEVAQGMSLTAEAVAVSQIYHLALKLPIGREGPTDGDGLGMVLGPTSSFSLFPAGTPSGHAATLFSTLGALDAWWRPPVGVSITTHSVLIVFIAMHALNHRHFISDSIWGGAMGYAIGRWVVENRASESRPERLQAGIQPWVPQGGGQGVVLQVRW